MTSIEDNSAVAAGPCGCTSEMGEIEAALSVYKNARGGTCGWQPQESDWLDLIQALTEHDRLGRAAYVMRDYIEEVRALAARPPEAGSGLDPETVAARAGAVRRNSGRPLVCQARAVGKSSSSKPSTCARKASSSCRTKCGEGGRRDAWVTGFGHSSFTVSSRVGRNRPGLRSYATAPSTIVITTRPAILGRDGLEQVAVDDGHVGAVARLEMPRRSSAKAAYAAPAV